MKWVNKCVRKLEKTLGVSMYRAEEICGSLNKRRKARKNAFRRTKSKAR